MEVDIDMVRLWRQKAATVNNGRENKRRYKHKYKLDDRVLILTQQMDPKLKLNDRAYTVESYNQVNGTLQIRWGNYIEQINIYLVRPTSSR
jgi:hypothetical protein